MLNQQEIIDSIYASRSDKKISDVEIPQDIKKYINKLEKVARYEHEQHDMPGVFVDNSKAHTLRCVYRASTISHVEKDTIRTLWIHDIPEYTGEKDLSAVARHHDESAAKEQENREKDIAQKIFSSEDFGLYENFHIAEGFVRKKSGVLPENQNAVLANVIDSIDGNLVFHYFYTKWLTGKKAHIKKTPSEHAFTYVLDLRDIILYALQHPELDKEISSTVLGLLLSQLLVIIDLWKKVPEDKIPQKMKLELLKMKNITCCY